jgi:hypothetical protein
MVLHVLNFLVKLVVLVKQSGEMMVGSFEFGNQFAVFGKHSARSFFSRIALHFTQGMRIKPLQFVLAVVLFSGFSAGNAIDLLPEDVIAPPKGLSSVQLAYVDQRRSGLYQRGEKLSASPEYNYSQIHLRYAHSFDWSGRTSVAYVQLPYYKVSTKDIAVGPFQAMDAKGGLGDMVLLLATWLHNDKQRGHYLGLGGYLFVPTGEYDSKKTFLVNTNPGGNRWRAALQLGHYLQLTEKVGWMIAFDTIWSDANTEAHWTSPTLTTRRQAPLNTLQTGLGYRVNAQLNLGLNYFYSFGGRSSLGGIENDDATRSHRYQLSTSYFLTPGLRLILQHGSELKTENGFKERGTTSLSITQYF